MDNTAVQSGEDAAIAKSDAVAVPGPSKVSVVAPAVPALTTMTTTTVAAVASGDELPYPPEKYPGKLCALCNLGERSQLGQGNMLKILVNEESMDVPERMLVEASGPSEPNSSFEDSDSAVVLTHKRQKNGNKFKYVFYRFLSYHSLFVYLSSIAAVTQPTFFHFLHFLLLFAGVSPPPPSTWTNWKRLDMRRPCN